MLIKTKPTKKDKENYKRLYGLEMKEIIKTDDETFNEYLRLLSHSAISSDV